MPTLRRKLLTSTADTNRCFPKMISDSTSVIAKTASGSSAAVSSPLIFLLKLFGIIIHPSHCRRRMPPAQDY